MAQLMGCTRNDDSRMRQSASQDRIEENRTSRCFHGWQTPGFTDQVRKCNVTTSGPSAFHAHYDAQAVVVQKNRFNIFLKRRMLQWGDHEVDPASTQFAIKQCCTFRHNNFEVETWVFAGKALDHSSRDGCLRKRSTDSQQSNPRVGQELDFVHTGSEVIEDGRRALNQGFPVKCRLHSLGTSVE